VLEFVKATRIEYVCALVLAGASTKDSITGTHRPLTTRVFLVTPIQVVPRNTIEINSRLTVKQSNRNDPDRKILLVVAPGVMLDVQIWVPIEVVGVVLASVRVVVPVCAATAEATVCNSFPDPGAGGAAAVTLPTIFSRATSRVSEENTVPVVEANPARTVSNTALEGNVPDRFA